MKLCLALVFLIFFQVSFVKAQTCEDLFTPSAEQKLESLRKISGPTSDFLFSPQGVENNPVAYKDFLAQLDVFDTDDFKPRQLEALVRTYIEASHRVALNDLPSDQKKRQESPEQALKILVDILNEQLRGVLSDKLGSSAVRVAYQKNRNAFKATAATAAWLTVNLMTRTILSVPIYLPRLNRSLSKDQKEILVEQLPKLSPAQAVVLINQIVPGGRGLRFYNGFQKIFWKLSLAAGLYAAAVSPPVIHFASAHTPFAPQLIQVKETVDTLWLKTFYSKTHLQNLAIEASQPFLDNPNDEIERDQLEARIRNLSFEELRKFIP